MHQQNLPIVVEKTMNRANVDFKNLSAVATATQPGLALSLAAGLDYSKTLISKHNLPFIPVHHMEAHALTVRMIENVEFPFLVLLASGGHCILCLAEGLGQYKILGHSLDEPPGAVFDKVARELGLLADSKFQNMSGGQAVELLAKDGIRDKVCFTVPLSIGRNNRSCNFSFSGLQTQVIKMIHNKRLENDLSDQTRCDIAVGFQSTVVKHISSHILRAILFCRQKKLLPSNPTLVLSGGVAANSYFRSCVSTLCQNMSLQLVCPPLHLCTDNGIMIAWTGMEYLKKSIGIVKDPNNVGFEPKSPLGPYIGDEVIAENIKISEKLRVKLGIS